MVILELIITGIVGLVVGGVIVQLFGKDIDADVQKVVTAFNGELASLKATKTAEAVKAVAPTTTEVKA